MESKNSVSAHSYMCSIEVLVQISLDLISVLILTALINIFQKPGDSLPDVAQSNLIICFSLVYHYITRCHAIIITPCVRACVRVSSQEDSGPLSVSDERENRTLDYPRHCSNSTPANGGYWASIHKWSNIEGHSYDLDLMSFRSNDAFDEV